MEQDQIVKRLEWLDDERRKDKTAAATMEQRLVAVEGNIPSLIQQVKELTGEISRLNVAMARFDQIEGSIVQMRVEFSKTLEGMEKVRAEQVRESEKVRRADLEGINKSVGDVRKTTEPIAGLKKSIQDRVEEEYRLGRLIDEVKKSIGEVRRSDEEYQRAQRVLEESRRQDSKRLTDLQSEVSAFRKRVDEQRGKVDLTTETMRKLEIRVSEFQAAETERRQGQIAFIEKQNMLQVDRDRAMKEWETRLSGIVTQAANLDTQLNALDATHRSLKRAQESFEEITQRFERRVNEITEMQRLVEERFRQEWVAFKADDQKRWTNYTLTSEEQARDVQRQLEKQAERLKLLEETNQELRDMLNLETEETQKRLQVILTAAHQLMDDYDNTFGSAH